MNSEECDNEPKEEGDGIHPISGIETLEENEGGYDDCRGEADVVHRVDTRPLRQQEQLESESLHTHLWRK